MTADERRKHNHVLNQILHSHGKEAEDFLKKCRQFREEMEEEFAERKERQETQK